MRLAALTDIHGNLPAFEAALKHVHTMAPDVLVICGDLVNGCPDSRPCWDLAQSLNVPILRGNHERYVWQSGQDGLSPEWYTERFAPTRWSAAQFSDAERDAFMALPHALRLPEVPDVLFVHASQRDDYDTVAAYTPESDLATFFPDLHESETLIVRGHNHQAQTRLWGQRIIATTGAVGLPLDFVPTAQYLIADHTKMGWHLQHQSVPYDLEQVRARFHDSGYLAEVGPMAQLLLREALTACPQVLPFVKAIQRWTALEGKEPSFDEAIARYQSLSSAV